MITVSQNAVKEILRLMESDPSSKESYIRVMVAGGGCSGMSYKLGFESTPVAETDKVFEQDGVKVVVDQKSYLYLAGTELDYSGGLNGTGLTFPRPNA